MTLLSYTAPIVGLPYHAAPEIWPEIVGLRPLSLLTGLPGRDIDALLVPEPDNPQDPDAIRVEIAGHIFADDKPRKIGYIRRRRTEGVHELLVGARVFACGLPHAAQLDEPMEGEVWTLHIQTDATTKHLMPTGSVPKPSFLPQTGTLARRPRSRISRPLDQVWF